ncbi:hypothetical protein LINGRAPRIM_LOCUS725 [Linum grandiflorum]
MRRYSSWSCSLSAIGCRWRRLSDSPKFVWNLIRWMQLNYSKKDFDSRPLAALLMDIVDVMNRGWKYQVFHVLREANQLANSLAKKEHETRITFAGSA